MPQPWQQPLSRSTRPDPPAAVLHPLVNGTKVRARRFLALHGDHLGTPSYQATGVWGLLTAGQGVTDHRPVPVTTSPGATGAVIIR